MGETIEGTCVWFVEVVVVVVDDVVPVVVVVVVVVAVVVVVVVVVVDDVVPVVVVVVVVVVDDPPPRKIRLRKISSASKHFTRISPVMVFYATSLKRCRPIVGVVCSVTPVSKVKFVN